MNILNGSLPGIIIALAAMLGAFFSLLQTRAVARAAKGTSLGPFNGYTQLLRDALARMEKLGAENANLSERLAKCEERHQMAAPRTRRTLRKDAVE